MIKRLLHSQLRINMASGVATTAVNTVVMAVGYPVYLHFLGYEQYGVWLVLATVLTFAQLGNLGIGPAVMKLVAEEHGRHDIPGIQRYVTTALALLGASGVLVLTVILLFRRQIIGLFGLTDANARTALWLLPYIGILSIYVFIVQVMEATLCGLGRMDLANYRGVLARVINVSASSLLLSLGFGVGSLLVGRITAEVVTHLAIFLSIRRLFGLRVLRRDGLDAARGKRLLSFGGMVFGGSMLNMLLSPFNKLVLSRYAGVATVPIYEIALTGCVQIRGLVTAGQAALVPEISRVSAEITTQARDRIIRIYQQSLKLTLLLATPPYAVLVIFAPVVLRLWLADRFVETLPGAFRIMLVGTFVRAFGVPAYYTLMGTGRAHHTLVAHLVQTGTNVAAMLFIVFLLDVSPAAMAWSSAGAMTVETLYLVYQNRSALRAPVPWGVGERGNSLVCRTG
jgi:O-antigen/teichoic acid export membrane protein